MALKRWLSKVGDIANDPSLRAALEELQANPEYDANLAPTCHRCTRMNPLGKRIHVDRYCVAEHGVKLDTPFVAFKAFHHGEESVIRLEGWSWPPRDGERFKFALARLPFFTGQPTATIVVPSEWNQEYQSG